MIHYLLSNLFEIESMSVTDMLINKIIIQKI